jgi:hypothetical protein
MSQSYANRLIAELDARYKARLATHRQVAALVANAVPLEEARTLSFDAASARLDVLLGNREEVRS